MLLVLFIFTGGYLSAQQTDDLATKYLRTVGDHSTLYYGRLQLGRPGAANHPYLVTSLYTPARLSFRGVVYPQVMLRLDLERDELVVLSSNGRHIVLSPEDLDYAEFHGRHIVYLDNGYLPAGHYMVLHSGNTMVLKRQTATQVYRQVSSTNLERRFIFRITYFLYKDGVYHTIQNRRGLLSLLYPHQRTLNRFISSNRLNRRGRTEEMITLTVIEYERLSALTATPLSSSL